jgi:7-cyano-7-deazaguanine reductase
VTATRIPDSYNHGAGWLFRRDVVPTKPQKMLETFPNPEPGRDYVIRFTCPEFTCLCPRTGQPDFATLSIEYVPDRLCVELKSLKLYLWSFRDEGHFHEAVINRILNDLVRVLHPRRMSLVGDFLVRGGIHTVVTASHEARRGRESQGARKRSRASR